MRYFDFSHVSIEFQGIHTCISLCIQGILDTYTQELEK